ncbi:hypothetical protein N9164_05975 [Draconibacterium sp.]|nr:hypothetical protein [Draconibacterium sp.]
MKNTFNKLALISSLAILLVPPLKAQDDLNQPNIRFYLSEDKSSYVGAVFINQIWTREIWNNPNNYGDDKGASFDMGIRRSRAIFYTYLFDKVFAYTMFGSDGISFITSGKPVVSLYNAQTEYIFVKDKFHLGFGLSTWNGISRYNNCKLLEFLVVDNPGFAYPVGGKHDRFGRQLGIYAKGTLSKLHYRVALVKPFKYDGINDSWTYGPKMIPNDNLAVKGYFAWHFFDKEGTLFPYMTMNNLGRAKLFNIGAGFYYHPDAMGNEVYGNGFTHNIFLYAIDAFLDMPLKKGAAITSYLGFNNFDFGPDYIRAQGTMNVSDSDPAVAIAQGVGNSQWEVGTGQIIRGELGYLLPGKGMKNRFQPYGALTWKNFDGLDESSLQFDAGINWLMYGHNIKWTLQYSSRPVYGMEDGAYNWADSKGEMILQTQIFF